MKNNNLAWIIVIIAALIVLGFMPFGLNNTNFWGWCGQAMFNSNSYGYGGMMRGYNNYGWSMLSGFGGLFMLAALVALVLLIVWLIQQLQNSKK